MKEFFEGKNKIRLYSIPDLCEMMGCTRSYVLKIIERGEVNVTMISGRMYVPEESLLKYLKGKPRDKSKEKRGGLRENSPIAKRIARKKAGSSGGEAPATAPEEQEEEQSGK